MISEQNESHKILSGVLAQAKKLATGADVFLDLETERSGNVRFAQNEVTSAGEVEETRLTLTVARGQRHASTQINQLDSASICAAIERADRMARLLPEDPEWLPLLPAQKYLGATKAFDPATEKLAAPARAEVACRAIAGGKKSDLVVAGFLQHSAGSRALANSAGLYAHHAATNAALTLTARTKDGHGSGWAATRGTAFSELDSAGAIERATDKAVRSQKAKRLEPGRYTVILEPAAVGELLAFLSDALDARRADEGRSFFAKKGGGTRIGEQLFGEQITLCSDPTDLRTPAAVFDDEGVPLMPTHWIDRGQVRALRYSRYWAKKQGKSPTGQPNTLLLTGGTAKNTEELLKGVKRGVLITRFWYTRWLDPQSILITGLTRDGVFLVEDGAISGPVNNFRFNESPITMLKNADALTEGLVRVAGGENGIVRVPALRTHEFNLASISEAV